MYKQQYSPKSIHFSQFLLPFNLLFVKLFNERFKFIVTVALYLCKLFNLQLNIFYTKTRKMRKKNYVLLGLTMLGFSSLFAQERILDKGNMREGENVEYCITHKKMNELLSNPSFAKQYEKDQQEFESLSQQKRGDNSTTKATVYTIPVVFHVLHNGGPENISKAQILNALDILNRDYAMLNPDTTSIRATFQGIKSKADIQFKLATIAPNGQCFSGITRTNSPMTSQGANGGAQVTAIVNGNDVYNGQWPGNKYLNIFICQDIGGAAGYTTNPSSWSATSMNNGIWILHNYVGNIGTSNENSSRALTHEVGHWLNLSHTWGPNNNPGSAGCGGTDNCNDTPATQGSTSCIYTNSCSTDNAYWGFDQVDQVENYMDYSYCSRMFTIDQVNRMRTALQQSSTGRANVVSAPNLNLVGANTAPALCKAMFSTPRTVICAGESIQFNDESFNYVTGWTWTFTGGTPSSSTSQNPTITYNTPGTYAVQLTATDGTISNTKNIAGYITVLPASASIPFYEGFESVSTLTAPDWYVYNTNGNTWEVTNASAATGNKAIRIQNFGQPTGNVDELTSRNYDLSDTSITELTLTFKYAYRKTTNADNDNLKVFTSSDCGENWIMRRTLSASTLCANNPAVSSTWTPSSSDFKTYHVTNISSSSWTENFKFKFQFNSGGGNNLYIDDINLYAGAQSDTPVTASLQENANIQQVSLYPNPTENELQLLFHSVGANTLQMKITDVFGKTVQQNTLKSNDGSNVVFIDTNELAAGTYMIHLSGAGGQQVFKFVKK